MPWSFNRTVMQWQMHQFLTYLNIRNVLCYIFWVASILARSISSTNAATPFSFPFILPTISRGRADARGFGSAVNITRLTKSARAHDSEPVQLAFFIQHRHWLLNVTYIQCTTWSVKQRYRLTRAFSGGGSRLRCGARYDKYRLHLATSLFYFSLHRVVHPPVLFLKRKITRQRFFYYYFRALQIRYGFFFELVHLQDALGPALPACLPGAHGQRNRKTTEQVRMCPQNLLIT